MGGRGCPLQNVTSDTHTLPGDQGRESLSSWSTQTSILRSHVFISRTSISHKPCLLQVHGEARLTCAVGLIAHSPSHCPPRSCKPPPPCSPPGSAFSPAWLVFCTLPRKLCGTRHKNEWTDKWIDRQRFQETERKCPVSNPPPVREERATRRTGKRQVAGDSASRRCCENHSKR